MANCGSCGSQAICTCYFVNGENATVTGTGRNTRPINYRPNGVPLPRPFGMLIRDSGTQVIPALTFAQVVFDTDPIDFASPMTPTVFPAAQLTATQDGIYLAGGFVDIPDTGDGEFYMLKNGALTSTVTMTSGKAVGGRTLLTIVDLLDGDTLELQWHSGSVDQEIELTDLRTSSVVPDPHPYFWACWMRGL